MNALVEYNLLTDNGIDKSIPPLVKIPRKKRDDLQCWRTVAIVGVVVFHIWPAWFPNGFVGVDIFFVLSGFLMATIIHKHNSKIDFTITKDFYFRRVKRIAPVYLLIVLAVLFFLYFSIWEEEYDNVRNDAHWAITFASNIQDLFHKQDYFDMLNNFRFFKHCWSLAVEMQFYLIVPILFMLWLNFWTSGKLPILITVFLTSITLQAMSTSETTRYESMFSRIWQFSIGIAAQSYRLNFVDFSSILHNIFIQTIFFFCLVLEFLPVALNREVVSILCVISSGFLIAVSSSGEDSPFNMYLMNSMIKKALVYCGDFSYILYLIHWPLITCYRFTKFDNALSLFEGSLVILACFMLAILCHHLIENPLINYCDSLKKLLMINGLLYSLIAVPLIYRAPEPPKITDANQLLNQNYTINGSTTFIPVNGSNPLSAFYGYPVSPITFEMFRRILKADDPLVLPEGWSTENEIEFAQKVKYDNCETWDYNCHDTYDKWTSVSRISRMSFCESSLFPNGNYTALVIGNSHAHCGAGAVHLNPLFKKVIIMSAHGVRIPAQSDSEIHAVLANKAIMEVIERLRPDVIFYINRHEADVSAAKVKNPITEDHGFQILDKMFKEISKYTQAIIISRSNFAFGTDISSEFLRLKNQKEKINFKVLRRLSETEEELNAQKRFNALNCPKCYFWDYVDVFCGENYCDPIDKDTGLPFMRDSNHVGILMQRKFRSVLDKLARKALNISNVDECNKL